MVALFFLAGPEGSPAEPIERYQVFYLSVGSRYYLQPPNGTAHGFAELHGALKSAKAVASLLAQGGSPYGITLTSEEKGFVTLKDIDQSLLKVKAHLETARAQHPLFIFYYMGHGLSEGVAWNHFSLPGNVVYEGSAADLSIDDLSRHTLLTASLVDRLQNWHIPFVVILDTCSEGTEKSFESSVLSATATQNLSDTAHVLRFMNEFHDTWPVLFAAAPGTTVTPVPDPLDGAVGGNVGPLARRMMLIFNRALAFHTSVSLQDFLQQMQEPSFDRETAPAITHSPVPEGARKLLFVPSVSPQSSETLHGTGTQADPINGSAPP